MFHKSPAYAADIKDLACDIKRFKKALKIISMSILFIL
jgi:hypothetical protein